MSNLSDAEKKHREDHYNKEWYQLTHQNWRAWGSWFSWGSPIGLALFYAIIVVSTGIFLWLIHHY